MTSTDQDLRRRRLVGIVLVLLALVIVPSIVSEATRQRVGEGTLAGHADCGSWSDPSELAQHRPALETQGCAQAIGSVSRTIALRSSAVVLLLVAGISLLLVGRVTRWIWLVGFVALVAIIYAAAQPGGLAVPITTFFYGLLVLVVVLGLLRSRSRARRRQADDTADA